VTSTDAFALKNSDLNAFLFADVGMESNGSNLTILSILARLGQDPWAEGARWTKLPKVDAIACLARSIGKMPLSPETLANTTAIASRLIVLLPLQSRTPVRGVGAAITPSVMPGWMPIAVLCVVVLISLALSITSAPVSLSGAAPQMAQTIDDTAAIGQR
jgi:hypothetical protein